MNKLLNQTDASTMLNQTDASTMLQVNKLKAPMTRDTSLSVMSDGMANITSTSLLNVICSNSAGQFFVKNIDTTGKEKTKEYIAEQVCLMIEVEGAENVVLLIMDGACRSSFPLINEEYPHIIRMICAAHSIDLLLEDFAKPKAQGPVVAGYARFNFDTSFTRTTLEHNREIVKFITNHSKPLSIYRSMVEETPREQRPRGGTELLKPGDTRFATEFIASERVLNCRLLLEQTVVSVEFNAWLGKQKTSVRDLGSSCKDLVLSVAHWNSTSAIVRATNPLYSMLRFCDSKRVPRNARARAISRGRGRGRRRRWVRDKGSGLSVSLTIRASHHATATCRSLAVVCMRVGNKPVLSKYYMKMLAEDLTLRGRSSTYPMLCATRCSRCSWRDVGTLAIPRWLLPRLLILSSGIASGRQSPMTTSRLSGTSSRLQSSSSPRRRVRRRQGTPPRRFSRSMTAGCVL
jgi:hypothetical protein